MESSEKKLTRVYYALIIGFFFLATVMATEKIIESNKAKNDLNDIANYVQFLEDENKNFKLIEMRSNRIVDVGRQLEKTKFNGLKTKYWVKKFMTIQE